MIGHLFGSIIGNVTDCDSQFSGGLCVHVVKPDSIPDDDSAPVESLKHCPVQLDVMP
jgi:hypothetical protein